MSIPTVTTRHLNLLGACDEAIGTLRRKFGGKIALDARSVRKYLKARAEDEDIRDTLRSPEGEATTDLFFLAGRLGLEEERAYLDWSHNVDEWIKFLPKIRAAFVKRFPASVK